MKEEIDAFITPRKLHDDDQGNNDDEATNRVREHNEEYEWDEEGYESPKDPFNDNDESEGHAGVDVSKILSDDDIDDPENID